jgi:predicted DCC family thiol-disulfide oxidoreductase YuxK
LRIADNPHRRIALHRWLRFSDNIYRCIALHWWLWFSDDGRWRISRYRRLRIGFNNWC